MSFDIGAARERRRALVGEGIRESQTFETGEAGPSAVSTLKEVDRRYRLLATMVQGTAATLPQAWQSYQSAGAARIGARDILHNHRVLRVAIVEVHILPQCVEWVGR